MQMQLSTLDGPLNPTESDMAPRPQCSTLESPHMGAGGGCSLDTQAAGTSFSRSVAPGGCNQ